VGLYLLRVGTDSTDTGGHLFSRIFDDRSYVFIPIQPDREEYSKLDLNKLQTYETYRWNGRPISGYVRYEDRNNPIHDDPEFDTFTYGSPRCLNNDVTEKNYNGLKQLKFPDILVFYAMFKNPDNPEMNGLYMFAYFMVNHVICWDDPHSLLPKERFFNKQ
jgi:hypothetical protein